MADITQQTLQESVIANNNIDYGLQDFSSLAVTQTFNVISEQLTPLTTPATQDASDEYSSKGKLNPEEVSPTLLADEAYKAVLTFGDTLLKQYGSLAKEQLSKGAVKSTNLSSLITQGVEAILGIGSGGFNFDTFSIIGSVLSALGFSFLGGIIGGLGTAKNNLLKAQEQDNKVTKEIGKNVAAALQETENLMQQAEGIDFSSANVRQLEANVQNTKATVSINEQTPSKTVSAGVYSQTSTDYVLTANYYKANHTHVTVTADNVYNVTTRHSTRYHSVSLVEIAANADYIYSNYSNYADFRWEQTGQGKALPITAGLDTIIGGLFDVSSGLPLTGVDISLSTRIKANVAKVLNMNYGTIYTIDGLCFINSGIGAGLAALPPKTIQNITDIEPPVTTQRPEPSKPLSINDKTYETIYRNNEAYQNFNLGKLVTDAINTAEETRGGVVDD